MLASDGYMSPKWILSCTTSVSSIANAKSILMDILHWKTDISIMEER